jgi:hypothetical protein
VHVGFAEQYRARLLEALYNGSVVIGNPIGENFGACRRKDSSSRQVVFDGKGNAVQRAAILSPLNFPLRRFCVGNGTLGSDSEVSVQKRIDALDSIEVAPGQLNRR